RRTGEDSEMIYTCYVTGEGRVLQGVVTVKELLLAGDDELIEDLMETDVITAETTEDREETVQRMMRYDFISMPVVDKEGRLVGIVTVDDVMDVMEEEATEDFEKMAAISPSEKPYLKTNPLLLAKNRIMWLLILMISGMITGAILGKYEAAFAAMPLLVTFIPMLTDTGGNAGSQSSTLIIRGMAVGEISTSDFFRVLWKELRVSVLVGVVLSTVNFLRLIITYPGNELIALTVALALFVTVVLAKTIGGVLPMLAKLIHADPAIMAAPLITTIVDAFSLVIYFSIAQRLLPV
ncbi:MAG: magnesium transporter, partial [Pseudoflavonifractor sp.]